MYNQPLPFNQRQPEPDMDMIREAVREAYDATMEDCLRRLGDEKETMKVTTEEIENLILWRTDQLVEEGADPMDAIFTIIRPIIQDAAPPDRRRLCTDLEALFSNDDVNRTGAFFNGFVKSYSRIKEDDAELARRIMEKRNPHYKPKEGK